MLFKLPGLLLSNALKFSLLWARLAMYVPLCSISSLSCYYLSLKINIFITRYVATCISKQLRALLYYASIMLNALACLLCSMFWYSYYASIIDSGLSYAARYPNPCMPRHICRIWIKEFSRKAKLRWKSIFPWDTYITVTCSWLLL